VKKREKKDFITGGAAKRMRLKKGNLKLLFYFINAAKHLWV